MSSLKSVYLGVTLAGSSSARPQNKTVSLLNTPLQKKVSGSTWSHSDQNDHAVTVIHTEISDIINRQDFGQSRPRVAGQSKSLPARDKTGMPVLVNPISRFTSDKILAGLVANLAGINISHPVTTSAGGFVMASGGAKPARIGDAVAHQKKSQSTWGATGGTMMGAAAVTGVDSGGKQGALASIMTGAGVSSGSLTGHTITAVGTALGSSGEEKGTILEGSPNVFFNGIGVARVGDKVDCADHPGGSEVLAEGAETVFANGRPIVRVGHLVTCDGKVNSGSADIVVTQATGQAHAVLDSSNNALKWAIPVVSVLNGLSADKRNLANNNSNNTHPDQPISPSNPDYPSKPAENHDRPIVLNPEVDVPPVSVEVVPSLPVTPDPEPAIIAAFPQETAPVSTTVATKATTGIEDSVMAAMATNPELESSADESGIPPVAVVTDPEQMDHTSTISDNGQYSNTHTGTHASDPVDVATGDYIQEWPVIEIPGVLPLSLRRVYRSGLAFNPQGSFGLKWADNWSSHLVLHDEENTIDYVTAEGALLTYDTPHSDVAAVNTRRKRYLLNGQKNGKLVIFDQTTQCLYTYGYHWGDKRLLSKIRDRRGNWARFDYRNHQLCRIVHSDGYELIIDMRDRRIYSIELVNGHEQWDLLRCTYDQAGYLLVCDSFQFGCLTHEYDQDGSMTRWHDTETTDVHIQYNLDGQVVALASKEGFFNDRFQYTPAELKTSYTNALGAEYIYYYNEFGLVTRVIDPAGNQHLTEWNGTEKIREIDALGRITRYEYAPSGQLIRILLGKKRTTHFEYDRFGQLKEIRRSNSDRWQYVYDESGLLRKISYPAGHSFQYQYDAKGRLLSAHHSSGRSWRYEYDASGLLNKVIHPNEACELYEMDRLYRLRSYTNPLGDTLYYEHCDFHASPEGSAATVRRPEGIREEIRYNRERLMAERTDGEGRTTRYTYGAFDLLLIQERADGKKIYYQYDLLTRLIGVINARGEQYQLIRNALGQIVEEIDFTGRKQYFIYDAAGRITHRQLEDQVTTYQYDEYNRLTGLRFWQTGTTCSSCVDEISYRYNKRDQLISATNKEATVTFEYDARGLFIGESINGHSVRYERDEQSQQLTELHYNQLKVTHVYSDTGLLASIQLNDHLPLHIQHDILGQEILLYNDAGFFHANHYDQNGLLINQCAGHYADSHTLNEKAVPIPLIGSAVTRSYQYDRVFNVTGIKDRQRGNCQYQYDRNDQMTLAFFQEPAQGETEIGFNYDANLNLITQIEQQNHKIATWSQSHDKGRVVRFGSNSYHYNAAGHLVEKHEENPQEKKRIWRYQWNALGQLTGMMTPENEYWNYHYDAFGRRIRKVRVVEGKKLLNLPLTMPVPSNSAGDRQQEPIGYDFFWNGNRLVEEIPLYADGTLAYDDRIFWVYKANEQYPVIRYQQGQLSYVICDQIGTPQEYLDEWGKAVWIGHHEVWGKLKTRPEAAQLESLECPVRFLGQYADSESGLHYNRFRYYDPQTAQYLSPDPIGLAGGINPYGYVHNPTGWVDPLGLASCAVNYNETKTTPKFGNGERGYGAVDKVDRLPNKPVLDIHGDQISIYPNDARIVALQEFPAVARVHGFIDIIDNYASYSTKKTFEHGAPQYQVEGRLNGIAGGFEWTIDPKAGGVNHRTLIASGKISAVPFRS